MDRGWLYPCAVLDLYSGKVAGWSMAPVQNRHLVLKAVMTTCWQRSDRSEVILHSDRGTQLTSAQYQQFLKDHRTRLVRSYSLRQEFITPHRPQQNGMVERVIRTLKEQCAHRHRFESQQHATRVIGDWIQFYNHRRPHQALGMRTPAEAYALAA